MAAPTSKRSASAKTGLPKKSNESKGLGSAPARSRGAAAAGARRVERRSESFAERLRGPRSLGYFLVFLGIALVIQGFHTLEHVVQVVQIVAYGVSPAVAGGLLGAWFDFPLVHFVYNFTYFIALLWAVAWAYGLGGFQKLDRLGMWMLIIATAVQTYHAAEHVIQLGQAAAFATNRPNGIIGFFVPNFWAHLILNAAVWVLPLMSFWRFGGFGVMKEWIFTRRVRLPANA